MKRLCLVALLLACACSAPVQAAAPAPAAAAARAQEPLPQILTVARPKGQEWMGLYVLGKKAGWAWSEVREGTLDGKRAVVATSHVTLRASVGGAEMVRNVRDERFYEFKDGGRLLALRQEKHGDGGDEILLVRCTLQACQLTRKRPGLPDEVRALPATGETVEHADAARIVAATRKPLPGKTLDLERTLQDKEDLTVFDGEATVTAAGITVPVLRIKTTESDSNLPIVSVVARDGQILEVHFAEVMVGRAESEQVAKQLDKVDIFNLTRVQLEKPLPDAVREPPAKVVWRVQGFKDTTGIATARQKLEPQADGSTLLTIESRLPTAKAERPVAVGDDKELADNLKSNLVVEADAPAIQKLAREVVGDEKDAWAAARRLNLFVNRYLEKSYGSSSDRATDVLANKRGDCTEHALLFTALLRASGIPARRVDGLVYMTAADGIPALYWHEWAEAWVGEWVAMDPTFNQPVADPSHVALGTEARVDTAALIGKLRFEVVSAEGSRKAEAPPPAPAKAPAPKGKTAPKK